jgi:beta-fructofuranosidase
VLDLPGDWVWDFWLADDGTAYHAFFLQAPRSLGDPELRHRNASVGHATSPDLSTWTPVAPALGPQAEPAFDDLATWTGCVIPAGDGSWRMFYTGLSRADDGTVQRVGSATSTDLTRWQRVPGAPLEADSRWYERRAATSWPEEAWRDPWVVRDDAGTWHMYLTARAGTGAGLGVVGHATSTDLSRWVVGPPLSAPTGRFEWLEVVSLARVEGRWVLLFSCLAAEMPGAAPGDGGVWSVPVDGPGSPVDVQRAVRVTSEDLYVGKVAVTRDGRPVLLAFANRDATGAFTGGVVDPVPVRWNAAGSGLELAGGEPRWRPPDRPGD